MMGKRNKRREPVKFQPPVRFIVSLGLVGAGYLGVWYVGHRCETLGSQIVALEERASVQAAEKQRETLRWQRMKSPENLRRVLASCGTVMDFPLASQVVRLVEPGVAPMEVARRESANDVRGWN